MHRLYEIMQEIEEKRDLLYGVAAGEHSLTSPMVLKASRELDQLLNTFEELKRMYLMQEHVGLR